MAKNEYQIGDMKQDATVSRGFGPGGGNGMGGGEKRETLEKQSGNWLLIVKNTFLLL